MLTLKIDGHGHCGEITFEAEVDPTALTICHCTDCQTITAAKAAAFIIGVLILGGVADVAYTEQRPGDCGYGCINQVHAAYRPCVDPHG
jgi:hypothetical protein